MKNTHRICSRKGCDDDGINKTNGPGTTWYCDKHYRFKKMRARAQQSGKVVPTWEQLEEMLLECLNEHGQLGKCPCCNRQMQWRAGAEMKIGRTISLQHNLDGTMCFICHSCNVGHGNSKLGDRYLYLEYDEKYCPRCDTVKSLDQFNKNRRNTLGVHDSCQNCVKEQNRKYRAERDADPIKRARYLAYMKEYHAAKKQEVLV